MRTLPKLSLTQQARANRMVTGFQMGYRGDYAYSYDPQTEVAAIDNGMNRIHYTVAGAWKPGDPIDAGLLAQFVYDEVNTWDHEAGARDVVNYPTNDLVWLSWHLVESGQIG
jgi:hypothetical protein